VITGDERLESLEAALNELADGRGSFRTTLSNSIWTID